MSKPINEIPAPNTLLAAGDKPPLIDRLDVAISRNVGLDIEMMGPEMRARYRAALGIIAPPDNVDMSRLPIGTPVNKVGSYPFPGTVVAAFHTLAGQERFVVEATGESYAGMLHIFNGGQLRVSSGEKP